MNRVNGLFVLVVLFFIAIIVDGVTVVDEVTTRTKDEITVSPRLVQLQQKLRDAPTAAVAAASPTTTTTQSTQSTSPSSSDSSDDSSDSSSSSSGDNFLGDGYSADELQSKMDAIRMSGDSQSRQIVRDNKISELESQLKEEGRRRKSAMERGQSEEIDSLESRVKQMESVTEKLNDAAKEQVDLLKQIRDKKDHKSSQQPDGQINQANQANQANQGSSFNSGRLRKPRHRRAAIDIVFKKLVNDLHLSPTTTVSSQANNVNPYAVLSAAALSKSGFGNPDIDNLVAGAGDLVGLGEGDDRVAVTSADGQHPSLVVPTVVDRAYLHAYPRAEPIYDDGPVLSPIDMSRLAGADAIIASQVAGGTIPNDPLSNFPVAAEYSEYSS